MTSTLQALPTGTWTLDPVHSQAGFSVKAGVATFRGHFGTFSAELRDGTLRGAVDVASVQVSPQMFKDHLLAPDFFDAEAHPEITFASSDIAIDEANRLTIRGELAIRGVTQRLEATGELGGTFSALDGSDKLGLSLETVVNRHDFGVSWNADLPSGGKAVGDDVTLTVDLTLVQA